MRNLHHLIKKRIFFYFEERQNYQIIRQIYYYNLNEPFIYYRQLQQLLGYVLIKAKEKLVLASWHY